MREPTLTICCIDTQDVPSAERALRRSMGLPHVEAVLLFSHDRPKSEGGITHISVPRFSDVNDYSHFVLTQLGRHITTSHVLIVQWDGFVIDAARWSDVFFDFDYIGAVWPQFPYEWAVGNGGFSLRSKKLLDALLHEGIHLHAPEDLCICHTNRRRLEEHFAVRFAPPEVAMRFAFERGAPANSLGFHGLFNFPILFGAEVGREIASLPLYRLHGQGAWDLGRMLIATDVRERWRILGRIIWATIVYQPGNIFGLLWRWLKAWRR